MTHTPRRLAAFTLFLAALVVGGLTQNASAAKDKSAGAGAGPDSVIVFIGNRMFPDFGEIVSTRLRQRQPVGDTEFTFEVTAFYPHFSIIDSTKAIVSLSEEPKNPAFRIMVYRAGEAEDSTWAFYAMDVPHFSRTSALWFRVLRFDYRGKVFEKKDPNQPAPNKGSKKK